MATVEPTSSKQLSSLARAFSMAANAISIRDAQKFISKQGPITSLVLRLRIPDGYRNAIQALAPGDPRLRLAIDHSFRNSTDSPLCRLRKQWRDIVGPESPWSALIELSGLHACIARGPRTAIHRLLDSVQNDGSKSFIAGVIPSITVSIPEDVEISDSYQSTESEEEHRRKRYEHADESRGEIESANLGRNFRQFLSRMLRMSERVRLREVLSKCAVGQDYFKALGIGSIQAFGPSAGHGQSVCILDSGADESHPMLRGRISHYARFDASAQFKRAHDCVDAGCHGTKIASLICGGRMSLADVGFDDEYLSELGMSLGEFGLSPDDELCTGLAPGARGVLVDILSGSPMAETGTIPSMTAGLDWVNNNLSNHPCTCLNISLETNGSEYYDSARTEFGWLCRMVMETHDIPIIAAAGNRGTNSRAVADNVTIVGAVNRAGLPMRTNGPRATILAPGETILCAQPPLKELCGHPVGVHSGSSFATAFVSASVALLCAANTGVRPRKVLEVIVNTMQDGIVDLDNAQRELSCQ